MCKAANQIMNEPKPHPAAIMAAEKIEQGEFYQEPWPSMEPNDRKSVLSEIITREYEPVIEALLNARAVVTNKVVLDDINKALALLK